MLHQFIITRFSIFDKKSQSFKLSRESRKNTIKDKLFNKSRLNFKFSVFDKMTYPSIKSQTYKNYTWLIYASYYLPDKYKKMLTKYVDNNIQIIYVKNFSEMEQDKDIRLKYMKNYATLRLDDDDGLSPLFLEKINKYADEKGSIISFPKGISYTLKNNKIIFGDDMYYQKVSAGLTAIDFDIMKAGDHTKVDKKYKLIYDNLKPAYYQCASEFCDTKRQFTRRNKRT